MFTHTNLLKCLGLQNITHINGLVFILQKPKHISPCNFHNIKKIHNVKKVYDPKINSFFSISQFGIVIDVTKFI